MTQIDRIEAQTVTIPTDTPEADGTLSWDSTTLVIVEVVAGDERGLGYTYGSRGCLAVIADLLSPHVLGRDPAHATAIWGDMVKAIRNAGREGVCACAVSAIDAALWDLRARLLDRPLAEVLGQVRDRTPIYGSGGFTNYDEQRLRSQLADWSERIGCRWVKMKIGADPGADPRRIAVGAQAAGASALMVDANGAFDRRTALDMAESCADAGVVWFEEPVSSDDLKGLSWIRDRAPPELEIAAGEYAWDPWRMRGMLECGAVDVIQADASRCLGVTGFMKAAVLAEAFHVPMSAHCAPALHHHPAAAAGPLRHVEWFFDHARIEAMVFDGAPVPSCGTIHPDLSRPGLGLEIKRADLARLAASDPNASSGAWSAA